MAASASLLGLDGWAYLTAEDPAERLIQDAVRKKAIDLRHELDENLASRIAASVRKIFP